MQIRRSVISFVVIIMAALIALVLWHGRKQPLATPPTAVVQTNATPPAAATPSAPVVGTPVHTSAPAAKVPTPTPKPVEEGKNQRMREILAAANDVRDI